MINQIKAVLKSLSSIKPKTLFIVGVSGGPDSICLLDLLNNLSKDIGLRIHIAHLNHQLRGKESDSDERFVKSLAQKLNLPITAKRVDIAKLSKTNKLSIEDCARRQRYKFFISLATKIKADGVFLAHTKNDLAETLLMRLIRGSGLNGLRGMLIKTKFEGMDVIRPLIGVDKISIIRYLKDRGIDYRIDSSNYCADYFRNRVRLRFLPELKKHNPNIVNVLADTASILADDFDYIYSSAEEKFKTISTINDNSIRINLAGLKKCHIAIRRLVARIAIQRLKGNLKAITYRNSQTIDELINLKNFNEQVVLPGNIAVKKVKDFLTFYVLKKTVDSKFECNKLNIPGLTRIDKLAVEFVISFAKPGSIAHKSSMYEYMDFDKIEQPVFVRTWREADTFRPLGLGFKKKLHDFFIDEKVPFTQRCSIPLLISRNNIIWIGGLRLSDDVKVDKSTKKILKIVMKSQI